MHGSLAGRQLRGRGLEQGGEDLGFGGPGGEVGQQDARIRLELGVAHPDRVLVGGDVAADTRLVLVTRLFFCVTRVDQRKQLASLDLLRSGRQEPGGDDDDLIDLSVHERRDSGGGHIAGMGEARSLAHPQERLVHGLAPEPEVALGLLAHGDQPDFGAIGY